MSNLDVIDFNELRLRRKLLDLFLCSELVGEHRALARASQIEA